MVVAYLGDKDQNEKKCFRNIGEEFDHLHRVNMPEPEEVLP